MNKCFGYLCKRCVCSELGAISSVWIHSSITQFTLAISATIRNPSEASSARPIRLRNLSFWELRYHLEGGWTSISTLTAHPEGTYVAVYESAWSLSSFGLCNLCNSQNIMHTKSTHNHSTCVLVRLVRSKIVLEIWTFLWRGWCILPSSGMHAEVSVWALLCAGGHHSTAKHHQRPKHTETKCSLDQLQENRSSATAWSFAANMGISACAAAVSNC